MDGMPPFIEHEQQIFLDVAVRLLVRRQLPVGEVLELHLQHELLVTLLLHELEEPPVLRVAHLRLVELDRGVLRIPRAQVTLRIGDELIDHLHLTAHQPRHGCVVLEVLDVPVVADGTGDDERGARFVDEHGVHFVHDAIDVDTLDVTVAVCPMSARLASRRLAKASGRISARVSAMVRRRSASRPPLPSTPPNAVSIRSRSLASLAVRLASFNSAMRVSRSCVRSCSRPRNFAVWLRRVSSLALASLASCSWTESRIGWGRFRCASWRGTRRAPPQRPEKRHRLCA